MPDQHLIWTVLPNGIVNNTLRASIFVTPRLFDGTQLGDFFPAFPEFQNWPAVVSTPGLFTLNVGGVTQPATVISSPDAAYWMAVFTEDLPVIPFEMDDFSQRTMVSFPVSEIEQTLRREYSRVMVESPTRFPVMFRREPDPDDTRTDLTGFVNQVGRLGVRAERLRIQQQIDLAMQSQPTGRVLSAGSLDQIAQSIPESGVTRETVMFALLDRYYNRSRPDDSGGFQEAFVPLAPDVPDFDFHRIHGILGDYPALMRLYGFVVDIEVPITNEMPAEGIVRLATPQGINGVMLTERTRYLLNAGAGVFSAKPKDDTDLELENGFLTLDNTDIYELSQLDVDGLALKNAILAAEQHNKSIGTTITTYQEKEEVSLPTQRTTGISIIKKDRAARMMLGLSRTMTRQVQADLQVEAIKAAQPELQQGFAAEPLEPPEDLALYADDLLRGYRVDVYDEDRAQWYSLCRRRGRYRINNDPNLDRLIDDEGYVKVSGIELDEEDEEKAYVHEALFQWDGWSLVAERPGMAIVPAEVNDQIEDQGSVDNQRYENVGRVTHTPPSEFELETWFIPEPGSLPRLRFGNAYRMRARAVDLAGNSLTLASTTQDMSHATERSCYLRLEPIPSPVVVLRSLLTEGEGMERLVLRSNYDQTPAEYSQDPAVQQALSGYEHEYTDHNERHIAPPKTSQHTAELHGAFEAAMGAGKNYQQWFNIAVKESGTFQDATIVDINTGLKSIDVPGIQLITPPGVPAEAAVDDLNALQPGDPLGPGQYVIHTADELLMPYLPDVVARGAAFKGLPGLAQDAMFYVSFENEFPEARSFRLRIVEGDGEPVFYPNHASGARVLEVQMQKGEIRKVQMSCFMFEQDLDHFQCSDLLNIEDPYLELDDGMRTQLRELVVEGQHWMVTPWRELTLVHAVQQPLEAPRFQQLNAVKSEPGQTFVLLNGTIRLDIKSTGRLDFNARWRDPVDKLNEDVPRDGLDGRPAPKENEGRVLEMKIEPYYDDASTLNFPIDLPTVGENSYPHAEQNQDTYFRHEFGDTRHRLVRYFMTGATRFRDYLPPEIYNDPSNISREGDEFEVNVLSTARPAIPKVLYIVPTFGWDRHSVQGNPVSRRCGGGLRVYLDRPWYSSGEGELLGVVLRAPNSASGELIRKLTTDWGRDPVWESLNLPQRPALENFPGAVRTQTGVSFEEAPNRTAHVAGHEVFFDEERKLWYCDITVDTGDTYYPFMRLALARYQPDSIADAHLSRVVKMDFIQTVPDRVAAINFVTDRQFNVMLSGPVAWNFVSRNNYTNGMSSEEQLALMDFSRHVTATLEKQVGGTDAPWVPVSDELTDVKVDPHQQVGARTIWMRSMELPGGAPGETLLDVSGGVPETTRYRVSLKEFEVLESDEDKNQLFANDAGLGFRLVYADSIELSP